MHDNPQIFLKRFPIPNRSGFPSREKKVEYHVNALYRSRDFFHKWYFATIIATRRGMAQHCGNPACKRKRACVGQMRPVILFRRGTRLHAALPVCQSQQGLPGGAAPGGARH